MPKRRKSKLEIFFNKLFGGGASRNRTTRRRATTRRRGRLLHSKLARPSNKKGRASLTKSTKNPILSPIVENSWESYQTFNPAALIEDGRVHLLYRALGEDGLSRLGYATSSDGINFNERSTEPAFTFYQHPRGRLMSHYDSDYVSGGGWGGSEDPRVTKMGDTAHMIFVAFDGMNPPRLALTSISIFDIVKKNWKWGGVKFISEPGVVDKSGCLFPEKIQGKYVIMHRVFPHIYIDYVDNLDFKNGEFLKGQYKIKARKTYWDSRKIGAGAPPIKTKYGWLLIYYAVDNKDPSRYKMGAMLLDQDKPYKVLRRTSEPVLEPMEWYENDGHKSGVVYPCGAVVSSGKLLVYYGGADTVVCVAHADFDSFVDGLWNKESPKLRRVTSLKSI